MRRDNKKKIEFKKPLLSIMGAISLLLLVLTIVETATSGAELNSFEKKASQLAQENQDLSRELIKGSSLNSFEEEASSLGFQKPQEMVYITNTGGVAKLP
jgi:cell division protein FtsL